MARMSPKGQSDGREKTISKAGKKPIHFREGGEHASLGVAPGKKISASQHAAARSGKRGALAKKQEIFRENVLTGGR